MRPGSFAWLLAHELRLDWRRRTERRGVGRYLAIVTTLGAPLWLAVVVGRPLGVLLRSIPDPVTPTSAAVGALAIAATGTLMFSQAMAAVVEALYERGDLELVFASPVRPERVVAVRALAIAFSAFSVFGFFLVGPLVTVALMAGLRWFLPLVALFALALGATGLALLAALALLRWVGPRRTRIAGHALATLVGAALFFSTQAFNILNPGQAGSFFQALVRTGSRLSLHHHPLSLGIRALSGEPMPFAGLVAVNALLFAAGLAIAGPKFATGMALAAGASEQRLARGASAGGFASGALAATYRKELRLIWRDPMLVPQVVLRILYLAPLAFVTARYGAAGNFTALSAALLAMVLMVNQLTGSLAWLAISGEDARDLLATAPSRPRVIAAAKLAAAATPAAAILAPVVLFLLYLSPASGAAALLGCAAALLSAGAMNLRWQRPAPRSEFRNRRNSAWFVTLVELVMGLLIATSAALLSRRDMAGLAPGLLAVLGLAAILWPGRRAASDEP